MKYDKEYIRNLLKEMDEKTGLNSSSLYVELNSREVAIGGFEYNVRKNGLIIPLGFTFSNKLIDGRFTKETIDKIIKHEYIHYFMANKYPNDMKKQNHSDEFKMYCAKYGTIGSYSIVPEYEKDFDTSSIAKKLVYVITCLKCKYETHKLRSCDTTKNIQNYKCSCGGELEVFKDYRTIL